jgi:hypothetical protein
VEDFLLTAVRLFILQELQLISEETKTPFNSTSARRFLYGTVVYELKAVEYASNSDILQIALRAINPVKSHYDVRPMRVALDSMGRYTEIQLTTDTIFATYRQSLVEVAKMVLEAGYRWLMEFTRHTINAIQVNAVNGLYSLLRRLFNEKVVEKIFLWKVVERKGVYVVDDVKLGAMFNRASERDVIKNASPIEIITNFSTAIVDLDTVISKETIAKDKALEGDFLEQRYAETGLDVAEVVLFETRRFVSHPIVREGVTMLVAAYPVELRPLIEPVIKRERNTFERIVKSEQMTIQKIITDVTSQGALPNLSLDELPDTWLVRIVESFELKPNIFGIGVNFNNLLLDFLKWHYGKRFRRPTL